MDDTFVCLGRVRAPHCRKMALFRPLVRARNWRLRARKKLDRVRQIFSDQSASLLFFPTFRNKNIVVTLQRALKAADEERNQRTLGGRRRIEGIEGCPVSNFVSRSNRNDRARGQGTNLEINDFDPDRESRRTLCSALEFAVFKRKGKLPVPFHFL